MDLVSVIIPTRNRAKYLSRSVSSALAQSHPAMEVVVVDDASEDESPGLLRAMAAGDSRLKVLTNPTAGGAPRARNAGAEAARGSILAFLDDDCVFHPEKTARQLPLMRDETGAVYCRQMIQQVGGGWEVEGDPGANDRPLEGLLNVGTNALMVRRDLFERVGGFDVELPRLQDWDLLLRLARETRFAFVPEILVQGVMVKGGITLTPGPLARAADRIVQKHAPVLDPPTLGLLYFILGKFLLVDGLTREARGYMLEALRLRPSSPRCWSGFMASLLGPGPARLVRRLGRDRRRPGTTEAWPSVEGRE